MTKRLLISRCNTAKRLLSPILTALPKHSTSLHAIHELVAESSHMLATGTDMLPVAVGKCTTTMTTLTGESSSSIYNARLLRLDVESKLHHVGILHHILFIHLPLEIRGIRWPVFRSRVGMMTSFRIWIWAMSDLYQINFDLFDWSR